MEPLIFPGDKFPVGAVIRTNSNPGKFIAVAGATFSYLPSERVLGYYRYEYYSDFAVTGAKPVRGLVEVQIQSYQKHYVFSTCPTSLTDIDIIRAAQDLLPENESLFLSIFNDRRISSGILGMAVVALAQRIISCAKEDSDSNVAISIQALCTSAKSIAKRINVRSEEDVNAIQDLARRLDKIASYANSIRLNQFGKEKALLQ